MKTRSALLIAAAAGLAVVPVLPTSAQTTPAPIPMTITVDGLEGNDEAVLRIGVDDGTLQLSAQPLYEYTVRGVSQQIEINPTLEDGGYLLVVDAPEQYFREPRGYLFRVYEGEVVNLAGLSIPFKLIPPEARDYEPYRGPITGPDSSAAAPSPPTGGVTYRVEAVVGLSIPPKAPIQVNIPPTVERIPTSYWAGLLGGGFGVLVVGGVVIFVIVRTTRSRRARRRRVP